MEIWLDAQLSPLLATWLGKEFSVNCFALRQLNLRDADDTLIFAEAKKKEQVIIMTKDEDFLELLNRLQAPPKIIWLTVGNCSNTEMKEILKRDFLNAISVLKENDVVEISG